MKQQLTWDDKRAAEIEKRLRNNEVFRAVGPRLREAMIAREVMGLAGVVSDWPETTIGAGRLHTLYHRVCRKLMPEMWVEEGLEEREGEPTK